MFKPEVYKGTGKFGVFLRLLFKAWSEDGNLGIIDEVVHNDFVITNPPFGDMIHGPEEYKMAIAQCRSSFPDMQMWAERIIWDDSRQTGVARFKWTGTHKKDSLLFPFPPSGNKIDAIGMAMIRMEGTQMIREWGFDDHLGNFMQMNVIPAMDLAVVKRK
ncbi:MAG: ester cyclase [Proteobacteria bacterium]|nr:ester cyclase [Pseudomonadota bacterium]